MGSVGDAFAKSVEDASPLLAPKVAVEDQLIHNLFPTVSLSPIPFITSSDDVSSSSNEKVPAANEEKKYVLEEDGFEEGELLGHLNQGNGEA